ncbi:SRPBCC family protein [Ferrimonas balearica]|uniref:SRPBCC family protein n=1 Tax=Ferrimonas balearica TaxID=44012 RepID=UPI001C994477|nr:SRPBCC family protein [Ferrimonas balearica]MBY5992475.1 SRPBCC family protein [Ferrimonas balearica]
MRYTTEVRIAQPRAKVVALFDNPDNLRQWQPELLSMEPLEGIPGQPGSRTRFLYRMGKGELEMVETIELRQLPERFRAVFEAEGVWNRCDNHFIDQQAHTLWRMENEFRCRGWMRLMTWFAPWMFKRQTRQSMARFQAFAEREGGEAGSGGSQ